jgi:hypothetical protein
LSVRVALLLGFAVGCSSAARVPAPPALRGEPLPGHEHTPDHSRAATPNERLALRKLMRVAERLRGLRFLSPVELRVEDRTGMRAYVARALDETELARARRRYVALGVLPAELDVRALLEDLLEDELVGYYDAETKRLVVRDELARTLAKSPRDEGQSGFEETLVHELVHALQDQHLGLGDHLHDRRSTDADNAYAALVEGDAQLTMLAYALETRGTTMTPELVRGPELHAVLEAPQRALGARMAEAPALVREPLLFRYRVGTRYAARLYAEGGFARIDAAHAAPPATTRAILAALRDVPEQRAEPWPVPSAPCIAALGFAPVDDDTLGTLEASIGLSESGALVDVLSDRYVVLAQGDALAAVWSLRLGAAHEARAAAAAFTRAHGAARAYPKGPSLLVVHGLPSACADALAADFAGQPPRPAAASMDRAAR